MENSKSEALMVEEEEKVGRLVSMSGWLADWRGEYFSVNSIRFYEFVDFAPQGWAVDPGRISQGTNATEPDDDDDEHSRRNRRHHHQPHQHQQQAGWQAIRPGPPLS